MINKINSARRFLAQKIDQVLSVTWKKIRPSRIHEFDNEVSFALLTVNFSTTYYLKLMLLTLCEQTKLDKISKIIIVDNKSRDGGLSFLQKLPSKVKKVELVQNNFNCTHARGLRIGIDYLDKVDETSNILMVCDTDIIFRNKDTLTELSAIFESTDAAFVGELRYSSNVCPQAQASFLCVRRDIYTRSDVKPFVNHSSPAYWMQKSLWDAGLNLHDFRSNFGGYILHRGRAGVAAASQYYPLSSFSKVPNKQAHFMGVENGEAIWQSVEKTYTDLLDKDNEIELINYLSKKLT